MNEPFIQVGILLEKAGDKGFRYFRITAML